MNALSADFGTVEPRHERLGRSMRAAVAYRRAVTWHGLSAVRERLMPSNIEAPPEGAPKTCDMPRPLLTFPTRRSTS